ncbi:hypothetical protein JCM16303_007002 [Sporobolomyces ruberrimus]
MRSTFQLSADSPWFTSRYGLSSPAFSDVSSDSSGPLTPLLGHDQDQSPQVYGSIALGGEVYCPHLVKKRHYEPPGSPTDFGLQRRPGYDSPGWPPTPPSQSDLCYHCEAARHSIRYRGNEQEKLTFIKQKKKQEIDPTRRMSQQDPPPCNTFYLRGKCATGSRCRYGHDYELNAAQIEEIRRGAKWHPCSAVQHGLECPDGETCIYGHSCPKGLNCRKPDCAFGADTNAEIIDLHGFTPVSVRELVWQSSNDYYQVYPRVPVPASPYYEVIY